MIQIKTRYQVDVWQEPDGWWLAEVWIDGQSFHTQGRNHEEIWEMIGDLVLTVEDVPISWWNSLLYKLFVYPKDKPASPKDSLI